MEELIKEDPMIESHRTANMPLPRFGKPEEIAESIVFLSSKSSEYIHGHNLVVDGGYLAVWRCFLYSHVQYYVTAEI